MLFTTSLLIFSFCFVFYIIWNQFLRKDTRLSIGLQVLQKKMDLLENFSEKSDIQLRKGIELLDKKNKELEKIVKEARFCIFKLEKLTMSIEKENADFKKREKYSLPITLAEDHRFEAHRANKDKTLESKLEKLPTVNRFQAQSLAGGQKENLKQQGNIKKFDFGESPFGRLHFSSTDEGAKKKKKPSPPYDPSPTA